MLGIPTGAYAGGPPTGAIIIFVVDESGSMGTEHDFLNLAGSITSIAFPIESALNAEGINNVKFGLVGYGDSGAHLPGHKHLVAGGDLGTAAQFALAADGLVLSGGFNAEDGYDGIDTALNSYGVFPPGVPVQIILVSDEDRDVLIGGLTFATISADLMAKNALLNVIVNCSFTDVGTILGIVKNGGAGGTEFLADGAGGFTTQAGDAAISCSGSSDGDYIDLADLNSGAAWDLNQLRAGGLLADSFSAAFVDIKVEEIMRMLDKGIGGEIIPINTTALLLAGVQSISMWMIPVVIAGAGIGVFVTMRSRK